MKKLTSILLSLVLILSLCSTAMLTVGAEETTASVWDGTANIKWYFDGKTAGTGNYELKSAADLAGFAYIVNASDTAACYSGVYYDANYNVLGYKLGTSNDKKYADTSLVYTPTDGDGSQVTVGDSFVWQNVKLSVDVVLNTGNAADWATTAPANEWQPIGGGIFEDTAKWFGFDGSFDGQGHTVSGMYVSIDIEESAGATGAGLFGILGNSVNASVANVNVENFYVEIENAVSALVGRTRKPVTVENCNVSNGYLVGNKQMAGALVGGAFGGDVTITNCGVNNVDIKGVNYIGGIVGLQNGSATNVSDSYCVATIAGEKQVAPVIGHKNNGAVNVKNVYTVVAATETPDEGATSTGAGTVAGWLQNGASVAAENYYYVKNITTTSDINGLEDEGVTEVTLAQLTGETAKTTLVGFDFETVWKMVENGTPVIEVREAPVEGGDEGGDDGSDEGSQGGTEDDGNDETEAPETNAPETNAPETNAPTTTEKSGCGSVIGFASIAMIVIGASACVLRKKEN